MKRFAPLMFVFLIAGTCPAFSQASTPTKTDVNKDIDVVKVYEQVVKEGYGTTLIYKKLANGYYFKGDYLQAKKWFETLFEEEKQTDKVIMFRYKQTLKALNIAIDKNQYLSATEGSK